MTSSTTAPSVLGPFRIILRYSGFDLTPTGGKFRTIISFGLLFLFCALVITNIVILMSTTSKPVLSMLWLDHAFTISIIAFSLASAIALGIWTYSGFIPEFEERLAAVKTNRAILKPESQKVLFGKCWFLFGHVAVNWVLFQTKGFLLNIVPKHSNYTVKFELSKLNLYGVDYLLTIFIILSSALAPIIFLLICDYIKSELSSFNKQLIKSGETNNLANQENLTIYSNYHFDLICLVKFANAKLRFLTVVAPGAVEVAFFFATVISSSDYKSNMRTFYYIVMLMWMGTTSFMHIFILESAGKVQQELHRTVEILMTEASLQTTNDESIRSTTRMMVDRCVKMNTCLAVFGCFRIDQSFFHKVMLLTALFGNSFAFLKSFYDQGHPDQPVLNLTNYDIYG